MPSHYGGYIAGAAENERNRRFQSEERALDRGARKDMFGQELSFRKEQYGNLWDIQKSNLDAQRNITNKWAINEELETDYKKRLEDVKEGQDVGMFDVLSGRKTGEEWGTGMRQRWGQRLNPWAQTDKELAGEPEYQEYTAGDIKNVDINTLKEMISSGFFENQRTDSTTNLMDLMNQQSGR